MVIFMIAGNAEFHHEKLELLGYFSSHNTADRLTDYFSELEHKLTYKHWYFGHYHFSEKLDAKHTILYEDIIPLE